jgi:hypothetical protein
MSVSALDYIDEINSRLVEVTVDCDELMRLLGQRTGGYLSVVEFRPSHEAFSQGELHLYHPNDGVSGVKLTVQAAIPPESFAERFGPPKRFSTNRIDTRYREQWFTGKAPGLFNRIIIDVSWEGLVQEVLLTRDYV